jgi:hypothetical protein
MEKPAITHEVKFNTEQAESSVCPSANYSRYLSYNRKIKNPEDLISLLATNKFIVNSLIHPYKFTYDATKDILIYDLRFSSAVLENRNISIEAFNYIFNDHLQVKRILNRQEPKISTFPKMLVEPSKFAKYIVSVTSDSTVTINYERLIKSIQTLEDTQDFTEKSSINERYFPEEGSFADMVLKSHSRRSSPALK